MYNNAVYMFWANNFIYGMFAAFVSTGLAVPISLFLLGLAGVWLLFAAKDLGIN